MCSKLNVVSDSLGICRDCSGSDSADPLADLNLVSLYQVQCMLYNFRKSQLNGKTLICHRYTGNVHSAVLF